MPSTRHESTVGARRRHRNPLYPVGSPRPVRRLPQGQGPQGKGPLWAKPGAKARRGPSVAPPGARHLEKGVSGRPVVIKIGGAAAGEEDAALDFVAELAGANEDLILVHGGGPLVGEWSKRLGAEPRFHDGLRV